MLPMLLPMLPTLPPPPQAPGVPPPRRRWGSGALAAVAGTPPRRRQGTGCPLPTRPPGPPHSDAARATVALDCYCAAGGVTVYSHGRRDRRTRTAGSTGSPHPPTPGGPRGGGGGGSRRGRPASRGSRSSHAGCSSPHINSYCSGGRAPSGSSSGSGNRGDPPPRIPHPGPRPAAPHLPSRRGHGAPRGPSPPGSSRRICPLGSRGPVPRAVSPRLAAGARGDRGAAGGAGLAAGPARRGLSAAGGAGAGAAGGGRRLHNPPGAARRFLSGEVRAARPAPAPGTGPSAAGGDRCWPGRAPRGGHRGLTALETERGGWKGCADHRRGGRYLIPRGHGDVGSGPRG
ncbi:collagen, type I, alpha 1b-like [Passer domesticus]|uniref:collagen, type I, alpha 1b-like n=1 Tax=Passer domesticus TaxID=48849 RepID=UPI0030FDFA88